MTQIVAATFNESAPFRRTFLSFLGVPLKDGLIAKTQVDNEHAPSRPDLIIFANDKPYVLIESKIEAKSSVSQQERHSLTKAQYMFLIARDPVAFEDMSKSFKKVTWYDFFSFIIENQTQVDSPVDKFLIQKLISFGKESQMLLPDRISKEDFSGANILLTQLRLSKSPTFLFEKRNPFNSMEVMALFLERVLIKVKDDPEIGHYIKPFTRRIRIGTTYFHDVRKTVASERESAKKRELLLKTDTINLEKEIHLKKSVNGFHRLYLRISFLPHYSGREITGGSIEKLHKLELGKISYRCEIQAGLSDSSGSYRPEDSVCFDDTGSLEFAEFYLSAVSNWKKKLRLKRKRS